MKFTIYALVDPNTHEVKYVGQTSTSVQSRFRHHLGAAKRNVSKPLYEWIRSLGAKTPIPIILQTLEVGAQVKTEETTGYENPAIIAEIKWMKRFERSRLFNTVDRDGRAYRRFVNK